MSEKSLLSLREIARELNTKYRTLVDYKNQFGEFITTINEGRQPKYRSEYLDLFQLILALKDEGYDTNSIKLMLSGSHPNPPDLDGWLEEWIDRFKGGWTDGRMCGWMDG